jgi:hypothetical protein
MTKNLEHKPVIRVSTGWGFANEFSPKQHQKLATVTDGVELSLTSTERFHFYLDNPIQSSSISVHLASPIPNSHRELLQEIQNCYEDIYGFVIHPCHDVDPISSSLSELDILDEIMIENLDAKEDTATSEELLSNCLDVLDEERVTIDLQHLSEHYTLEDSKQFISDYGNKIGQFHVSGRSGPNKHEMLVTNPENKDEITKIVEYIASDELLSTIPLVIEGKYTSPSGVEEEYNYLSSLYSNL